MRIGALLLVVCAACGGDDDGGGASDASAGGDAAALADGAVTGDGGPSDATLPGPVLVRVQYIGVSPVGISILLHGSDAAVVAEAVTDDAGQARFDDPPAGAMVSALVSQEDTPQLRVFTVVGVEPGDVIVIGDGPPTEPTTSEVEVDYPGPVEGADTYLTDLGCDVFGQVDPDALITRDVPDACLVPDGDYDALAMARAGTTPLAFATVRDVPPSAPTAIALPAWVPATSRQLSVFNPPAEATDSHIELRPVLGGTFRWPAIDEGDAFVVPTPAQVDGWYVRAQVAALADGEARIWSWRQVLPPATASPYNLDFADFGPRIDAVVMDSADPLRPQISWQTSATTGGLGAMVLVARWSDPTSEPPATHQWTLVMPPGTAAITLPGLPEAAASYRPSATAESWLFQVYGFWYARHGDYAGFRNDRPFALGQAFVDGRIDEARMIYLETGL